MSAAKKPSPKKSGAKPFKQWRKSNKDLAELAKTTREETKKAIGDAVLFQSRAELQLKVIREVREQLLSELKVRKELNDLRDRDLKEMTDDSLQRLLERTILQRGYRQVRTLRSLVLRRLTEYGFPFAQQFVDEFIPAVAEGGEVTTLSTKLAHDYDRIERDLEQGAADLKAALESEEELPPDPYAPQAGDQEPLSDEDMNTKGTVN